MTQMTQDSTFADAENALAARLIEHGFGKGPKLERAMLATEFRDILPPLLEALARGFIDPDQFFGMEQDWLRAFLLDLPSRAVTLEMRRRKHAEPQQAWEPNDLNDIVGLSLAAAYCGIVVTERQWTSHLRQARVETAYDTILLADLTELTGVLTAAART